MPASLPDRQRRYLALKVAGHSYREICALTGASYTTVNKHLTRARARVRAVLLFAGCDPGAVAAALSPREE